MVSRDPNDDVYLAAAAEGQADFLVSGDNDLLSLRDSVPIKIVSPAEFLDILERVP